MRKDRIGEKFKNKKGENYTIIEYNTFKDCVIQFEDGTIIKNLIYSNVRKGEVKNPNFPAILGVGYIGVGKYKASDDNKKHNKIYLTWYCMFQRCYSELHQIKAKTYKDCSVVEEWHNFQNFAQWYEDNWKPWMDNKWQLDKDILVKGNKVYSPETCAFVPREINVVFVNNLTIPLLSKRGNHYYPMYKKKHIGKFDNYEEALKMFFMYKQQHIDSLTDKWEDKLDERLFNTLKNFKLLDYVV
jgi:hypothetical protein